MKTIHLIQASTGEYEERSTWPIVVVESEAKARELIEEFTRRGEELLVKLRACKRPDYPKGKVSDEEWEAYIQAVYKNDDERAAIHDEHPASKFADIELDAEYSYEKIVFLE